MRKPRLRDAPFAALWSKADKGFTLPEVIVVLALVAVILSIGYPALQNMVDRSRIEAIARQTSTLMAIARSEAVKRRFPVVVRVDSGERVVEGFVDADNDGDLGAGDIVLRRHGFPQNVELGGPAADADPVDAFSPAPGTRPNQAIFRRNGTVDVEGAFRFVDGRQNYLEVRVQPRATARATVRKWDGSAWRARGENDSPWKWN